MTSPFLGDERPPENPEPDPALAGFPPPQPYHTGPYAAQPYPTGPYAPQPYPTGPYAPQPYPYAAQPYPTSPYAAQPYPTGPAPAPYPGAPGTSPPPDPAGAYPPADGGLMPTHARPIFPYPVGPAPVSALPTEPRPYHQMLRGPRYRWWKPIVTLLLTVALGIPLLMLSFIPLLVMGLVTGAEDLGLADLDVNDLSPTVFAVVNLSLILLIPLSGLTIWIVHQIRPRYLSSVAGGIRWRWLVRCTLVVLPLWLVYLALGLAVSPPESPRPDDWLALLVIVLVMTPFQAAGEEYFFRGWLMQNIGAWFARPIIGLVVSIAVSTVVFAAAHGSPDPWIIGTFSCFAVVSGIAAYRTGGLEASIAMHAVNNVLTFGAVLAFGGWEDVFADADTAGTPAALLLALLVHGGALALILWQAKRRGIQAHYQPTAELAEAQRFMAG